MISKSYFRICMLGIILSLFPYKYALAVDYLSGRVFKGNKWDESTGIYNVTVKLYGSANPGELGTQIGSTTTDGTGWYQILAPVGYEYYHIVETDLTGYYSVGVSSVDGDEIDYNHIRYSIVTKPLADQTLTGNKFWDKQNAPDIEVSWNSVVINDGSTTPSSSNGTDFGSVNVSGGTVTKTYTIKNTGNVTLTLTGATLSGSGDFTVTSQPGSSVAAGATTTFSVRFDPSAAGTRTATVNIGNNSSKNPYDFAIRGIGTMPPAPEIDVRGNGISIPDGDTTPELADGTDMGSGVIGAGSISKMYVIHNIGTDTLKVLGVEIYPDTYWVGGNIGGEVAATFGIQLSGWPEPKPPVLPGDSLPVGVELYPSAAGTYVTTLSITNNDADENPYNFDVQGTGIEAPQYEYDFGDAPDPTYPTLLANNGARHRIDLDVFLGMGVDAEADGLPMANALGDDTDGSGDEDGVVFTSTLVPGTVASVTVTASVPGLLYGWIDFKQDGQFDVATDHIFTGQVLSSGPNVLGMNIPSDAVPGWTFARFRFSTNSILDPEGEAPDGEVEDYAVEITESESGSVIILKEANPQDDTSFLFCVDYLPGNFFNTICTNLRDPSSNHLAIFNPDQMTKVQETVTSGWTLTDIEINGDSDKGSVIDLSSGSVIVDFDTGENIVITFKNEKTDSAEYDFGDAPYDPSNGLYYPTKLAQNGARHDAYYYPGEVALGIKGPDMEIDGQANVNASGDDDDGYDDEDGVILPAYFIIGQPATIIITATGCDGDHWGPTPIRGWIDFDQNGNWEDPAERYIDDSLIGTKSYTITVPQNALTGTTFARFRVSFINPVGPDGYGGYGEVEDYKVTIVGSTVDYLYDFGDAPEGVVAYPSTGVMGAFPTCTGGPAGFISHAGPWSEPYLGPISDGETDGNAGQCAGYPPYDQDEGYGNEAGLMLPEPFTINSAGQVVPFPGYSGTPLGKVCETAVWGVNIDIWVRYSATAYVNVLIDWNQDGQWGGASPCPGGGTAPEHVLVNHNSGIAPFGNPFSGLASPPDFQIGPNPGFVWARFTISYEPVPLPWDGSGTFNSGETEDYLLYVAPTEEWDFGDAPEDAGQGYYYPTTLANNSARHLIDRILYLGSAIDGESDGLPSNNADGDNLDLSNDEDGVTIPPVITAGQTISITVIASNTGLLNAWIDFNIDGDWADQGEHVIGPKLVIPGANVCNVNVPANAVSGQSFARFRLSTVGNLNYDGEAPDGEVEDYPIVIQEPGTGSITIIKDATPKDDTAFWITTVWNFMGGAAPFRDPSSNTATITKGPAGIYSMGETVPSGWTLTDITITGDSDNGSVADVNKATINVDLDDGENITVVFKNAENGYTEPDTGIGALKWSQAPLFDLMTDDTTSYFGWPESSNFSDSYLADDWFCHDPHPVTSIRWWGSYAEWDSLFPPPEAPQYFRIGIWTDVPEDTVIEFSHPGELIQEWSVPRYDLHETIDKIQFDPEHMQKPATCFRYTYYIPQSDWFYQEGDSTVYWMSIGVHYDTIPGKRLWCWLTREHYFNDDAVRLWQPLEPYTGAVFEGGEPITDLADLAFELGTDEYVNSYDFGDAPDIGYGTTLARNGAQHLIYTGIYLGGSVDSELDGQPGDDALGDDHIGDPDDHGITFLNTLIPGEMAGIQATVSTAGFFNAWIDFNGDGTWNHPEEQVINDLEFEVGTHITEFPVPEDALNGYTFARFRFSTWSDVWVRGFAGDGEVEDYRILVGTSNVNQRSDNIPDQYRLYQNYPNPFNPVTTIKYSLHETAQVQIVIYDLLGKKVTTLVNDRLKAGIHTVQWNTSNLATGIYICKLITKNFIQERKMLLLK